MPKLSCASSLVILLSVLSAFNCIASVTRLGHALTSLGHALWMQASYSKALEVAPMKSSERPLLYANRAACCMGMEKYREAVQDCSDALILKPDYMKAYMRRSNALEKMDELERALQDVEKVLELEPGNAWGAANKRRLGPIVEKKREELKEEMMGKLKDLGNTVLGNFGLSLDNFKAQKDPNTGSYSISFQK